MDASARRPGASLDEFRHIVSDALDLAFPTPHLPPPAPPSPPNSLVAYSFLPMASAARSEPRLDAFLPTRRPNQSSSTSFLIATKQARPPSRPVQSTPGSFRLPWSRKTRDDVAIRGHSDVSMPKAKAKPGSFLTLKRKSSKNFFRARRSPSPSLQTESSFTAGSFFDDSGYGEADMRLLISPLTSLSPESAQCEHSHSKVDRKRVSKALPPTPVSPNVSFIRPDTSRIDSHASDSSGSLPVAQFDEIQNDDGGALPRSLSSSDVNKRDFDAKGRSNQRGSFSPYPSPMSPLPPLPHQLPLPPAVGSDARRCYERNMSSLLQQSSDTASAARPLPRLNFKPLDVPKTDRKEDSKSPNILWPLQRSFFSRRHPFLQKDAQSDDGEESIETDEILSWRGRDTVQSPDICRDLGTPATDDSLSQQTHGPPSTRSIRERLGLGPRILSANSAWHKLDNLGSQEHIFPVTSRSTERTQYLRPSRENSGSSKTRSTVSRMSKLTVKTDTNASVVSLASAMTSTNMFGSVTVPGGGIANTRPSLRSQSSWSDFSRVLGDMGARRMRNTRRGKGNDKDKDQERKVERLVEEREHEALDEDRVLLLVDDPFAAMPMTPPPVLEGQDQGFFNLSTHLSNSPAAGNDWTRSSLPSSLSNTLGNMDMHAHADACGAYAGPLVSTPSGDMVHGMRDLRSVKSMGNLAIMRTERQVVHPISLAPPLPCEATDGQISGRQQSKLRPTPLDFSGLFRTQNMKIKSQIKGGKIPVPYSKLPHSGDRPHSPFPMLETRIGGATLRYVDKLRENVSKISKDTIMSLSAAVEGGGGPPNLGDGPGMDREADVGDDLRSRQMLSPTAWFLESDSDSAPGSPVQIQAEVLAPLDGPHSKISPKGCLGLFFEPACDDLGHVFNAAYSPPPASLLSYFEEDRSDELGDVEEAVAEADIDEVLAFIDDHYSGANDLEAMPYTKPELATSDCVAIISDEVGDNIEEIMEGRDIDVWPLPPKRTVVVDQINGEAWHDVDPAVQYVPVDAVPPSPLLNRHSIRFPDGTASLAMSGHVSSGKGSKGSTCSGHTSTTSRSLSLEQAQAIAQQYAPHRSGRPDTATSVLSSESQQSSSGPCHIPGSYPRSAVSPRSHRSCKSAYYSARSMRTVASSSDDSTGHSRSDSSNGSMKSMTVSTMTHSDVICLSPPASPISRRDDCSRNGDITQADAETQQSIKDDGVTICFRGKTLRNKATPSFIVLDVEEVFSVTATSWDELSTFCAENAAACVSAGVRGDSDVPLSVQENQENSLHVKPEVLEVMITVTPDPHKSLIDATNLNVEMRRPAFQMTLSLARAPVPVLPSSAADTSCLSTAGASSTSTLMFTLPLPATVAEIGHFVNKHSEDTVNFATQS